MSTKTIAIIGGSSGIGLSVARLALARGDSVIIGGRTRARLDAASAQLGGKVRSIVVDGTDQAQLKSFFEQAGTIDHLFTPGASYTVGAFRELSDEAAQSPFANKFWAQYFAVKAALPHLAADGSVVLMAGAAGARPVPAGAAYAACNSAIESLGRSLAMELAPVRVNTVSPGTIDSDLWAQPAGRAARTCLPELFRRHPAWPRRDGRGGRLGCPLPHGQPLHDRLHHPPRRRLRDALGSAHERNLLEPERLDLRDHVPARR